MNLSSVEIIDKTESIQDDALRLAPVSAPRVLVARVQTAGRGRTGPFHYFPGQFCGSFIFPLTQSVVSSAEVATALSLVQMLRKAEPTEKFEISYPNDILRNGLKVAGILAEARSNFVIGVGINQSTSSPEFGATAG